MTFYLSADKWMWDRYSAGSYGLIFTAYMLHKAMARGLPIANFNDANRIMKFFLSLLNNRRMSISLVWLPRKFQTFSFFFRF